MVFPKQIIELSLYKNIRENGWVCELLKQISLKN
jgi:hypothetical protein